MSVFVRLSDYAHSFSFAHETAPSATFPNIYAGYKENYITPLVEWCKGVYRMFSALFSTTGDYRLPTSAKHLRGGKKAKTVPPDAGVEIVSPSASQSAPHSPGLPAELTITHEDPENREDAGSLSCGLGDSDDEMSEISSIGLRGLSPVQAHTSSPTPPEIETVSLVGPD